MADISNIVSNVLNVARTVGPLIPGLGTGAAAAAQALEALLRATRQEAPPRDRAALDAELTSLQQRVGQRAEDIARKLEGGGQ